jgi:2-polyprenyl-3-methyl-5-hydroxy-6-metoxy-1,4-benzoquinol methylase
MNDFDEAYGDDHAVFGEPYPELMEYFESRCRGALLDLGSGQGRNAVALAAIGYDVTAVDASPVGVDQAVRTAAERGLTVRGVAADLTEYAITATYDVILIDMVLHSLDHGSDRRRLLEAVARAVRPGGTAYVVLPEPGPLVDEVVEALSPWPTTVQAVHHHLAEGEHAGDYTFTAVISERPTA